MDEINGHIWFRDLREDYRQIFKMENSGQGITFNESCRSYSRSYLAWMQSLISGGNTVRLKVILTVGNGKWASADRK